VPVFNSTALAGLEVAWTMKAHTIVSLGSLAHFAVVTALEKRQFNPFMIAPLEKPVKYVESKGTVRPDAKHIYALYGPFTIPAGKVSSPHR
jgi:hypothetical protein